MNKILTLLLIIAGFITHAQSVIVDPTFNPINTGDRNAAIGSNTTLVRSLILPSGKLLLVGEMFGYRDFDSTRSCIVQLNSDGSADNSFNTGTGAAGPTGRFIASIARQPDSKLIIGGAFASFNGVSRSRIARLNADGSLDNSFNPGTGFNSNAVVYAICILPSGKVIVGGSFFEYNGQPATRLVCLNADGSRDTEFDAAIPSGQVLDIKMQNDGKLLVAGTFTSYNGSTVGRIIRIDNNTGALDPTFLASLAGANGNVNAIAIQPNNQVLLGGNFTTFNGSNRNRLVRLNSDGTIDATFSNGNNFNTDVRCITVLSDGNIAVGGNFSYFVSAALTINGFVMLDANGQRDPTFEISTGFQSQVRDINELPDNRLLVVGAFTQYQTYRRNNICMLNRNGSININFENGGNGPFFDVNTIATGSGNSVYIGGSFSFYNNEQKRGFVKLKADGTIDTSMNIGTGLNGDANKIIELPDRSVVVGGNFTNYKGYAQRVLIKIAPNGNVDTSFAENVNIITGLVRDIALQGDNKIIIGGTFTTINGTTRSRLARLNVDGTVDLSFNANINGNSISKIVILNNGKILVAGQFEDFGGVARNRIALLNDDGSLDATFNAGLLFSPVNDMVELPNGKIIIAGEFQTVNDIPMNRIARLNPNGTLDNTFNIGTGVDFPVKAIQLQADSKIILGGSFTSVNNIPLSRLARLNADGSVDKSFEIGTGFGIGLATNTVECLHLANSNHLYAGGNIGSFNGIKKAAFFRLISGNATPLPVTFMEFTATRRHNTTALLQWKVAQSKENDHYQVQRSTDGISYQSIGTIKAFNETSNAIAHHAFTDIKVPATIQYYRIKQVDKDGTVTYSPVRILDFATSGALQFRVHPNPVTGQLNIHSTGLIKGNVEFAVIDVAGRLKLSGKLPANYQADVYALSVHQLPKGVYFLKCMQENMEVSVIKFIKQ